MMSQSIKLPINEARILAIDDRLDNLELLSTMLRLYGYKVEECNCGKSALELAKTTLPDLILLDANMPDMDGFSVCQRLKNNRCTREIPVIFISALQEIESKTKAFKFGGNDYITKPFQIEEVLARVETQLKYYYLQAELKAKNQQLQQEVKNRQAAEAKLLKLNQKLNRLATLDSLTKIANRYYFDQTLTKEWLIGQRQKWSLSLILCDVDHFKLCNDYYGHQAGDRCLEQVAQAISKTVNRPADLVARYGGEEFGVIIPQTTAENALHIATKIRQQIEILNIPHSASLVSDRVSLSLGVASVIPNHQHSQQQLLVTADKALYQAKSKGRNCISFKSISDVVLLD